jgi:hypothetical protein
LVKADVFINAIGVLGIESLNSGACHCLAEPAIPTAKADIYEITALDCGYQGSAPRQDLNARRILLVPFALQKPRSKERLQATPPTVAIHLHDIVFRPRCGRLIGAVRLPISTFFLCSFPFFM